MSLKSAKVRGLVDLVLLGAVIAIIFASIIASFFNWGLIPGIICLAYIIAGIWLLWFLEDEKDLITRDQCEWGMTVLTIPVALFCIVSLSRTIPSFEIVGVGEDILWGGAIGTIFTLFFYNIHN